MRWQSWALWSHFGGLKAGGPVGGNRETSRGPGPSAGASLQPRTALMSDGGVPSKIDRTSPSAPRRWERARSAGAIGGQLGAAQGEPPASGTSSALLGAPWPSPQLRADSHANPIPGWRLLPARREKRATRKAGLEFPFVVDGITVPPGAYPHPAGPRRPGPAPC